MNRKNLVLAGVLACMGAAHADVTVNVTTAGKAAFFNVGGDGVNLYKGKRYRSESMVGKKMVTLITDIDNMRWIEIDDKKKTATVTPLASVADELAKVGVGAMDATLNKTSQTKQIAGFPCTVHDLKIALPFSLSGDPSQGTDLVMVASGTACLSTAVPGLADYQAFYKAAADSGFVFGNPAAAKSSAGAAQAKAFAALWRKMAEAGMVLESHMTISAAGDDPVAAMMAKFAASDISTTVTKVETGEVPADKFDIPAGYKVKTQK